MNKNLSFSNIENFSFVVEINELFNQYTNEVIPKHYNSNFVLLKFNPTLEEFKILERIHGNYQTSINQNHLKFCWPENLGLYLDILEYLNQKSYKIGMQELMILDCYQVKPLNINKSIRTEIVTEHTLEHFLKINYAEDLMHSKDFAVHKQDVYRYQFRQPHVQFLLAYDKEEPVGSLVLISSKNFLELDNVLTSASSRNKKIATTLINDVIETFNPKKKPLILVVDAEDTPRELYLKCGFKIKSTQISAEKER